LILTTVQNSSIKITNTVDSSSTITTITETLSATNDYPGWLSALIFGGLGVLAVCILVILYTVRRERARTYLYRNNEYRTSARGLSTGVAIQEPGISSSAAREQGISFNLDNNEEDIQVEITINDNPDNASSALPAKIILKGNTISVDGRRMQINIVKNSNKKE
jgi:hypothetical protein